MTLYNNLADYYDSFYTQKIVNSMPEWARGRLYKESVSQRLTSSFAMYIEDLYRGMRREFANHFVSTCQTDLDGLVYTAQIPDNFLFTYRDTTIGTQYLAPIITASDGVLNYVLTILEDLEDLDRAIPTRLTLDTSLSYEIANVVDEVLVDSLSLATINAIEYPNWLFLTIANGVDFGSTVDASFFYPSFAEVFGQQLKGPNKREFRTFFSNDIMRTVSIFLDIEAISLSNTDSTATIKIDPWGFNLNYLLERGSTYTNVQGTYALYYKLGDDFSTSGLSNRSVLEYCRRESTAVNLLRQGYDSVDLEVPLYLLDSNSLPLDLNDIAKHDFADRLYAVSDTKFYIYDTYVPAITDSYILEDLSHRIVEPHMVLEPTPIPTKRFYKVGETVTLRSHAVNRISRLSKPGRVRVSYRNSSTSRVYIDKVGNSVTAEASWRYDSLRNRGTLAWVEKKWKFTIPDIKNYVFTLEVEYLQPNYSSITDNDNISRVEKDVLPILVGGKLPLVSLDIPVAQRPATGVTVDFEGSIWIKSEATSPAEAYQIDLHYDYCLVDYDGNLIYMREPFTEIVSVVSTGEFSHSPGSL